MDTLINPTELDIFLYAIYKQYKIDFNHYKRASLQRRLEVYIAKNNIKSLGQLIDAALYNEKFFSALLNEISVPVTELFRDPHFFLALRNYVLPLLKTYPAIKIWVAGCATGEEAYSIAMLLAEENMLDKSIIYATDINSVAIEQAKSGRMLTEQVTAAEKSYKHAGGTHQLSQYFDTKNEYSIFKDQLRLNIKFDFHNITGGSYISGLNMILCRNVFIYFDRQLQNDIIGYFLNSLRPGGFLGLGDKESVQFSQYAPYFEIVKAYEKIYRKRYT